jgi:F-type H+-transporting ATPase subunit delta
VAKKSHPRRYAQAVFEIAQQKKQLDKWQSDLVNLSVLSYDKQLTELLESNRMPLDAKIKLLASKFPCVNPLALNLVSMLLVKGRMHLLGDITAEYQQILDSHRGIEQAKIITSVPLNDEEKKEISERLGKLLGKKVNIIAEVDPAVIGGFVARVGGKLIDGSTRHRLELLKQGLAGAGG